jgi:hypothetical protein
MSKENVVLVHYQYDLPATYYRAIGEVIMRTALLETLLMDAIAVIAGIHEPKKKRVLLMSMSIKPKTGILRTLANKWLEDPLRTEFNRVCTAVLNAVNFRNKVAHGTWGKVPGTHALRLAYIDEGKDVYLPKSSVLKSKDILDAGRQISALNHHLGQLVKQMEKAQNLPPEESQ